MPEEELEEQVEDEKTLIDSIKEKNQRNIDNNEKNIRAAATVLKDKGIPYASAIAKGVDIADKVSGGRSTKRLAKDLNRANKIAPHGRKMQRRLNRLGESGVPDSINGTSSTNQNSLNNSKADTNTSSNNTEGKGNFEIKIPIKNKVILYGLIILIPLLLLMLFVVIFGGEVGGSLVGKFTYGQTCTTVTVENTGCDMNAGNCSHVYDGNVELEEYIAGVVAAEVGGANELDYYKVAAIAARTFFLNNVSSSCTVDGNATFQAYMDVEDSSNEKLIKQAVEETEGLVLVKDDELADTYYASACVVNADEEYYYVRYGTMSLGEANFQKIPKEWDQNESAFQGNLGYWYSMVDQSDTDYENKTCPSNHDYGMSQIGALYLITTENYDYEEVIKYYFGEDAEIMKNEMQLGGVDGFINPTRYIYCTSPFGYRIHPVKGNASYHTGLDIAVSGGEPIYAAKDGIVRSVITNVSAINNCTYGYGNYVIIDHSDGISTLYAHIKYGTIPDSIYVGAEVMQGEQIGQVGSTGCSTGNHLHYEVRQNNSQVNPADYIDLTAATGTCRR